MAIEYRWAEGRYDRLPALAADLVSRRVAVIAATGGAGDSDLAAKMATTTIPIVFLSASDPVKRGLVASLNRPGGNVTGVSFFLRLAGAEAAGAAARTGPRCDRYCGARESQFCRMPTSLRRMPKAATRALGRRLIILNASTERDIDTAFATLIEQRAGALLVSRRSVFSQPA